MNLSLCTSLLAAISAFAGGDDADRAADARFFESEVRPILDEHCFRCHGPERRRPKGGLRLAGHASLLEGGDTGPAISLDAPDASLLLRAVRWEDEALRMPPKNRLSDREIERLADWVRRGAPWPEYEGLAVEDGGEDHGPPTIEEGRAWWSFRPVGSPAVPDVAGTDRGSNPIDAFVEARLAEEGITPAPRATPRTLVRRLSYDLLGLPPARSEVERFERDPSDEAWTRLVDEYLGREEYGERWGRHWLDVVRFAQTNGYEKDAEKPFAWRYRDYVIRAFNEDKPFDRFVMEQLAGDELDDVDRDARIATGFHRVGVWDDEPDDAAQAVQDELDDIVRTTSEGLLGLTVGCARCHDHKFDPIRQEDYTAFLAFFRGVRPYEKPFFRLDSPTLTPLESGPPVKAWREERRARMERVRVELDALVGDEQERIAAALPTLSEEVRQAFRTPAAKRTDDQELLLRRALAPYRTGSPEDRARAYELREELESARNETLGDLTWALVVKEDGATPPPTHLLVRGDPHAKGPVVAPRFPPVVCPSDAASVPPEPVPERLGRSSGRRRRLAEWIASPENPLTARVLVNRLWHHHFGRGIVATPNDFGRTGTPPTHPALLDWLAAEFVRGGWSVKAMHRTILASETWRRSSRAVDETAVARDEANRLLWRQNARRLEAEAVRDTLLAVAGLLEPTRGGRGFFPELAPAAMSGASRPGEGWGFSDERARRRRSVYVYAKRNLRVPLLESFDAASVNLPVGARPVTTVATQALMLLNGRFTHRAARALADRIARAAGPDGDPVDAAWSLVLGRPPSADERSVALEHLDRAREHAAGAVDPVSFGPRTGPVLERRLLAAARGEDLMIAPADGFSLRKGAWGNDYNDTEQVDPMLGPSALAETPPVDAGEASVRFSPGASTRTVGLLLRARSAGDLVHGVEVRLRLDAGRVELVSLDETGAPTTVAAADRPFPTGGPIDVSAAFDGPSCDVRIDGAPTLAARDDRLDAPAGTVGLRVDGDPIAVTSLSLTPAGGAARPLVRARPVDAERRALESLALVLLNLNEIVTVD